MRAYSVTIVKVFYCLCLTALAGCVSSGAKPPAVNAPCKSDDGCPSGYQCLRATTGASGLFCCKDKNNCGPGATLDGAVVLDGPSSKGGAMDVVSSGGGGGIAGAGGAGGSGDIDALASGGAAGEGDDAPMATGGTSAGGTTGDDAPMATGGTSGGGATGADTRSPDAPADVFTPDAPGTCGTDKDCPTQKPLCLGNQCAKCASDNDCVGRSGPACATSGLCVACTANSHCKGTAATCDTATNQCVGCTKRSDCSGACQTCAAGVCVAVKSQDDPTVCAGTCDATGACKSKQGQTCKSASDCVNSLPCVDGYCCDKACTGTCQACDVATSIGTCTTLGANATPRPGRTACVATDATCAGKCDGTSAACAYPSNTSCGTASCVGTSYQAAGTCGNGACNMPSPQACSNACVPSAGGCVACAPGTYQCSGTQPQKCDSAGTWQNYGGRACTGSCETCTSSATNATCTNVSTPPSGKSCNGTDATCKGYCSGNIAACTYPDSSVPCSSSTCSSGSLTTQYCNAAGSCSTVKNQSCGGFPCASGSACSVSCTARSTTGCMDGYKCVGGNSCVPASVPCGTQSCTIANNGLCCATLPSSANSTTPWNYTCENTTTCSLDPNRYVNNPNFTRYNAGLVCGSRADCPSGQICCMSGISCDGTGTPSVSVKCTSNTADCVGGPYNFGMQLCDPSLSPTECMSGTCQSESCVRGAYSCR